MILEIIQSTLPLEEQQEGEKMNRNRMNLRLFETDANFIDRTGADTLIPEERANEIIQGVVTQSAVLSRGRRLANMSSRTYRMPVLDMLPLAYFVNGDTGQKKTTKMAWDKKLITAEEIAVIVPIPEAVLDDSNYDIWGEVRPRIEAVSYTHLIWFGLTWNYELYTQANKRLHRQGQTEKVIIHHLVSLGTRDEDVMQALERKEDVQNYVMESLKARIQAIKEGKTIGG